MKNYVKFYGYFIFALYMIALVGGLINPEIRGISDKIMQDFYLIYYIIGIGIIEAIEGKK